jgi:outer membrane protein OmpA-like peptidoglycan-associated protein
VNAAYAPKDGGHDRGAAGAPKGARAGSAAAPLWRALSYGAQPKLTVSEAGDPFEIEADRVADRVMRAEHAPISLSSAGHVHRKCAACEAGGHSCPKCEEEALVQRQHDGAAVTPTVDDAFGSGLRSGFALPVTDRRFYEARMGHDFGDVRIHTGAAADSSARQIGARAFTRGRDVAFAEGEYQPASAAGRHLLAHELTHVVQQRSISRSVQRAPGPDTAEIERSKRTPGQVAGTVSPPSFSLYNFAINESALKARHYDALDELGDLISRGVIANVHLTGHADSTGDMAINDPLSNDRATSVQAYLTVLGASVAGINSSGSRAPVASNGTEAGRSRNRRVDITFDVVPPPPPPVPVPEHHDPPPDGGTPPPPPKGTDLPPWQWPNLPNPCEDHLLLCGAGLFCILNPEICALGIPWPHIPWPFGGDDGPEDPTKKPPEKKPDEKKPELKCGDPKLPPTHVEFDPPSGDKGNRMVAEPLTRCQGNTVGSEAKRSDPRWPTGWECVVAAKESHLWARAHLLHGPTLHGPGNVRQNIIIADKSINKQMSDKVELDAIDRVGRNEVLWYEVDVNHFTGAYARPYFGESVHMKYGELDPITRVRKTTIFDDTIDSATHRVPPPCPGTTPPPPPPPQHTDPPPQNTQPPPTSDDPQHQSDDTPPCDRPELARRVDDCIDRARQKAIDCTLKSIPLGGWGGVGAGVGYLLCLDDLKKELAECDRKAKADTHCPDAATPAAPPEQKLASESFDSTLHICRRLLNSRNFHVAHGRVEVDIDADWLDASGGGPASAGSCPMTEFHVSLEQVGMILNSEIGTQDVPTGKTKTLTWTGLDSGEYFLNIWTNNDNPECCLDGKVSVRAF